MYRTNYAGGAERCKYQFEVASPLPFGRVVKLDSSGELQLAGASDANAIGYTGRTHDDPSGGYFQDVLPKCYPDAVRLEIASGDSLDPGEIAYQAADGKVASTGTVRIGVCVELVSGVNATPGATTYWIIPG